MLAATALSLCNSIDGSVPHCYRNVPIYFSDFNSKMDCALQQSTGNEGLSTVMIVGSMHLSFLFLAVCE